MVWYTTTNNTSSVSDRDYHIGRLINFSRTRDNLHEVSRANHVLVVVGSFTHTFSHFIMFKECSSDVIIFKFDEMKGRVFEICPNDNYA